jgi:hypothetical protein
VRGSDIGLVSVAPLVKRLDNGWIVIILWILRGLQRQALSVVPLSILRGGVICPLFFRLLAEGARGDLFIIPFEQTAPWGCQGQFDLRHPDFGCRKLSLGTHFREAPLRIGNRFRTLVPAKRSFAEVRPQGDLGSEGTVLIFWPGFRTLPIAIEPRADCH